MILTPILTKFRLRSILVVPFVLQIVVAVGLVGYLSYRNGQKAIDDLASQLGHQVSDRVSQHLDSYFFAPRQLNEINLRAYELGLLNLKDFNRTGQYFWKQMQVFNIGYINYANQQGEFIGIERTDAGQLLINELTNTLAHGRLRVYSSDNQGNRVRLLETKEYDPRDESWYTVAIKTKRPVWSEIYQWEDKPEILSISSSFPVRDRANQLVGVIGVDLILSQISDFLKHLNISPSGKVFIVERGGLMVASSSPGKPYRLVNGSPQRVSAAEIQEPLIQAAAKQLNNQFQNFNSISSTKQIPFSLDNGDRALAYFTPWKDTLGLNWLIVIVVPESDFMEQISVNTRNTILLCLAALGLAIAIGILTARWVTRSILRISQASAEMALGNIDQHVASSNLIEIDRLATSFNGMAGRMKQSFDALRQSEAHNQAILNAIPDLILRIHQDGRYLDVMPAKSEGPMATRDNRMGKSVYDILPTELAQKYLHYIHQSVQSSETQEFEYQLLIGDRLGDYEARVVRSGEEEAILIVRDITERKRSEAKRKQAEAALVESEERFRSLVANIPGAIYRCQRDSDWTMHYISDAIATISGYPASDFIQNQVRTYASIIDPDDREVVEVIVNHAVVIQEPYTLDYRVLHRDGSIRWVYEQGQACFDDEGNLLYLDGAIFDISDRKDAEEALRIAEENYRSIFENALEGIFQSSPEGRFISVNPAMAKVYGYDSPQEMMDTIIDIATQIYVDPSDQAEFKRQLEEYDQVKNFEYRVYQKDGQIIWIQEDTRAVRDNTGHLLYYEGIIQDITVRKRREDELRRELAELKIEIDQKKREKEVTMLTESSYFQEVQQEIEEVNLDEFWK